MLQIAVLIGVAALLAVPGPLSAGPCDPVPYDDLGTRAAVCSFMKAVDDAAVMDACGGRYFCPEELVTREDMAVFLEQALEYKWPDPGHAIGIPTGELFPNDVPATYGLAPWIEQLKLDGITGGCETGKFCPYILITRAEMSVLISGAMTWTPSGSTPIPVSGSYGNPAQTYNCVAGGVSLFPVDVPPTHWACPFIHYMAAHGVTSGCAVGAYCPNDYTPRWQMAVFLQVAFALP